MSHFDEASKAGFALNYDGEKLTNMKITPQQRKSNVNVKIVANSQKPNENGDFEKFNFDADVNLLTDDKDNLNKVMSNDIQNEEDKNIENTEDNEEPINIDNLTMTMTKLSNINNIIEEEEEEKLNHQNNVNDTNLNYINQTDDDFIHEEENAKNLNDYDIIIKNNIIQNNSSNLSSSHKLPVINNNKIKINKQNFVHKIIDKNVNNSNKNKILNSNNDFFLNEEELVK